MIGDAIKAGASRDTRGSHQKNWLVGVIPFLSDVVAMALQDVSRFKDLYII